MRAPYLEVTYRRGRPLAAYLYLPRAAGERSSRTRQFPGGLVVDYNASDEPIGVELTAPTRTSVTALNRVLAAVWRSPDPPSLTEEDLAPLRAA